MNLTGKQLVEQGIITGDIREENIAQHGVDLNLIEVRRISGPGFIPLEGKTKLAFRSFVEKEEINVDGQTVIGWKLTPGAYDITFEQGCDIPNNQRLQIVQRSSLLRNGAILRSSMFDSGFKTNSIGTVIYLSEELWIQEGARVAQIYATSSNTVENLYNGQFQGDKQRDVNAN